MIEASRLSYTSAIDFMGMTISDFIRFRNALGRVLEREKAAAEAARSE